MFSRKKKKFSGKKNPRVVLRSRSETFSHASKVVRSQGGPGDRTKIRKTGFFLEKTFSSMAHLGGGGGTRVLPSGLSTIFAKKWFLRLYDRFAQKPEKVKFRRFLQKMCKISTLFCTLFCTFAHVWSPYQKCIF